MDMQEILKGIRSRSKLLSRQYGCQYEDLFQDGMVHLLVYSKKNPDASFKQIMKSINYAYRDMSRKLRTRKRRNVSLESLPESFSSYEIEDELLHKIDYERLERALREREDEEGSSVLLLAKEFDMNLKEIGKTLGLTKGGIYTKINKIRKEIE